MKIKKNIKFVLNEEVLVLLKKIFEKFKKRRPWEIGKIRNKNHPKIRKILETDPLRFITVSYRKGLRVF